MFRSLCLKTNGNGGAMSTERNPECSYIVPDVLHHVLKGSDIKGIDILFDNSYFLFAKGTSLLFRYLAAVWSMLLDWKD